MSQVSYDTEIGNHDGLPCLGREAAELVAWLRDGSGLRCALHEEPLLDIRGRRQGARHGSQRRRVLCGSQTHEGDTEEHGVR